MAIRFCDAASTLTSKGQTTIPLAVREQFNLKPGDRLLYDLRGEEIVVTVHPGIDGVFGALKGKGRSRVTQKAFAEVRERAANAWARDAAAKTKRVKPS